MTNLRGDARVVANEPLTEQIYRLRFECAGSEQAYPGQFVNVSIPGFSCGARWLSRIVSGVMAARS